MHFGPAWLTRLGPPAAPVVVGKKCEDLTNRTVVEAPHSRSEPIVKTEAQTGDDRQPFRLGQIAGFEDGTHSRAVDGNWLLGEDVLAGFHGRPEVDWAEVRRRAEQHHVDPTGKQLTVGIKANETT